MAVGVQEDAAGQVNEGIRTTYGYHGEVLHIELGNRSTGIEEPGECSIWP